MYLVYTTPRRSTAGVVIIDPDDGREVFVRVRFHRREHIEDQGSQAGAFEEGTIQVEGRDEEASAAKVARTMAREFPTEDVFVAKVTQVFSTTRPDIIEKKVSEKGVLPA